MGEAEDRIKISGEVVETIVGVAASEANDVASLSGTIADGIAGALGRKNLKRGVKIQVDGNRVNAELSIVVDYGCKIHEIAKEIQDKVRNTVEEMTGMTVTDVVVNVVGVNFKDKTLKAQDTEGTARHS